MDISRYIRSYLSTLKAINKSNHTIRNYSYDLNKFEVYIDKMKDSDDLQAYSLKELCLSFVDTLKMDENGTSYQRRSLNRKRSSMRSFIRFLATIRAIPLDFSDEIEMLQQPEPQYKTLNPEEVKRILTIFNQRIRFGKDEEMKLMHHRNKLAFIALLDGGMKVSELIKLKWTYLRLDKKTLVIPKTRGLDSRTIEMTKRLQQEFLSFQKRLIKFKMYDEDSYEDYIFFGTGRLPHQHINPKTIERMVESIAREAAISKEITAQSLRHTMALQTIQQDNFKKVTPMLGFSRNSVTKHMYLTKRS